MRDDAKPPAIDQIDLLGVLHALSEPVRMHIVQTLARGGEHAWGALEVPVANSTLSQHLKVLRAAGVTRTRKEGRRCFVSLRDRDLEARFPGVLSNILAAAPPQGLRRANTQPPPASEPR